MCGVVQFCNHSTGTTVGLYPWGCLTSQPRRIRSPRPVRNPVSEDKKNSIRYLREVYRGGEEEEGEGEEEAAGGNRKMNDTERPHECRSCCGHKHPQTCKGDSGGDFADNLTVGHWTVALWKSFPLL